MRLCAPSSAAIAAAASSRVTGLMITGPAAAAANCGVAVRASRRAKYWLMPTRAVMTSKTASADGGPNVFAPPVPCSLTESVSFRHVAGWAVASSSLHELGVGKLTDLLYLRQEPKLRWGSEPLV